MSTVWNGCYDDGWKGIITDESFAHPAKFAKGLIQRIYDHLAMHYGLIQGMTVVDPFGGVGLGGIIGATKGLRWIGCELEPRFVEFGKANFKLHRRTWEQFGDPMPVIVQGDSRELCKVLGMVGADVCVSSPPYNPPMSQDHNGSRGGTRGTTPSEPGAFVKYGNTPGQLEGLPMGSVDAIVSSPPYAETVKGDGTAKETAEESRAKRVTEGGSLGQSQRHQGYGGPVNLGNLPAGSVDAVVSSPPYANDTVHNAEFEKHEERMRKAGYSEEYIKNEFRASKAAGGNTQMTGYGTTPGQLGSMPPGSVADAVVSSPPWESNSEGVMRADKFNDPEAYAKEMMHAGHGCSLEAARRKMEKQNDAAHYGQSQGRLGNSTGETFWSAARQIVQQSHAILKPGGIAVWVTKDFVRNKALVPFSDDWRRLCEACGFEMVEWIQASLVKETRTDTLFDGPETKRKERKSFFRRLAEKKGSPRIDHEDVLIMRK